MTNKKSSAGVARALTAHPFFLALTATTFTIATFLVSLFFSDEIAHAVRSGLSLCSSVIIPSVFPFMVISDFLVSYSDYNSLKILGALFEKTFKITRRALPAYLLGVLCGFPLGVKYARDLYCRGEISKSEAERLVGFSNNTGPAFLVSGIGLGLRGNITEGIILYFVMVISSVLVGILFSIGNTPSPNEAELKSTPPPFSLTESIKKAGSNTLVICSYLTFFACFCGCLRKLLGECIPYLMIIPLLEVGSATSILSKTKLLNEAGSLILTAFSVGFSGFSVHLQAKSFLFGTDISTDKYFIMKLIQGVFSALLTLAICYLGILEI